MILRRNVQYRGSLSRLPILVLECSNKTNWRGRHTKQAENWLFQGADVDEINSM